MAEQTRETLKTYFETGDYPTQDNFSDLIDSNYNKLEDTIPVSAIEGVVITEAELDDTLQGYSVTAHNHDNLYFSLGSSGSLVTEDELSNTLQGYSISGSVYSVNGVSADVNGAVEILTLPDQTDNSGKLLTTDGATASWVNRTINTKSLSADINLSASDIGLGNVLNIEQKTYHGIEPIEDFPSFRFSTLYGAVFELMNGQGSTFRVWCNGISQIINESTAVYLNTLPDWTGTTADYGIWYIYYNNTFTLTAQRGMWDIANITTVPVAILHYDGINGYIFGEWHTHNRNVNEHKRVHLTTGAQYISGFENPIIGSISSYVASGSKFQVKLGSFCDEDLIWTSVGNKSSNYLVYRDSAKQEFIYERSYDYVKLDGNRYPYWDNEGTIQSVSGAPASGVYTIQWMYVTNLITVNFIAADSPLITVMGQGAYATFDDALAAKPPEFPSGQSTAEWKLLYRMIAKSTNTVPFYNVSVEELYTLELGPANTAHTMSLPPASWISFQPTSSVSADTVSKAINILDTKKLNVTNPTVTGILTTDSLSAISVTANTFTGNLTGLSTSATNAVSAAFSVSANTAVSATYSTSAVSANNADTLDGYHSGYFAPSANPTFSGTLTVPTITAGTYQGIFNKSNNWSVSQSGAVLGLSVGASGIPIDLVLSNNFSIAMPQGGTRKLELPTNPTAGQSGAIIITQHSVSASTLTYDTFWDFTGTTPNIDSGLNSVSILYYFVYKVDTNNNANSRAHCSLVKVS